MNRFVTNRRDGKLMGVAAGLADSLSVDPLIVRLGIVVAVLITGPIALIVYVAAGFLAPKG